MNTKDIPNALTVFRIILVIPFVWVLVADPLENRRLACFIFVLASLTDYFDGFLARKLNASSNFGKLFDPLADKILVSASMIMLITFPHGQGLASWFVVAMLSREMVITGFRSVAASSGTVIAASKWAKHKTAWTMVGIVFLLFGNVTYAGRDLDLTGAGVILLWWSLFLAWWTAGEYLYKGRHLLR